MDVWLDTVCLHETALLQQSCAPAPDPFLAKDGFATRSTRSHTHAKLNVSPPHKLPTLVLVGQYHRVGPGSLD
ncbi:hypothetical protein KDA_31180 [Dictyobacter alpinus]|uniref:Uncharacterized protein n=1 Tax=Dictyobacter alpinus TaxID=2014873 RepID=A0A402B8D7_9CHLR|nr:hypothetical protein KDA_31180 [Dictyobacter alpinus]